MRRLPVYLVKEPDLKGKMRGYSEDDCEDDCREKNAPSTMPLWPMAGLKILVVPKDSLGILTPHGEGRGPKQRGESVAPFLYQSSLYHFARHWRRFSLRGRTRASIFLNACGR